MRRLVALLLAFGAIGLQACGQSHSRLVANDEERTTTTAAIVGDEKAIAACRTRSEYRDSTLSAAFDTTVGELKAWMDSRQPSDWGHVIQQYERDRPDTEPLSLCWVDDGSLAFPTGGAHIEGRPRAALVIVEDGELFLLFGGYFERSDGNDLAIADPSP